MTVGWNLDSSVLERVDHFSFHRFLIPWRTLTPNLSGWSTGLHSLLWLKLQSNRLRCQLCSILVSFQSQLLKAVHSQFSKASLTLSILIDILFNIQTCMCWIWIKPTPVPSLLAPLPSPPPTTVFPWLSLLQHSSIGLSITKGHTEVQALGCHLWSCWWSRDLPQLWPC